ncbi:hypothetical protein B0H15DRAFT_811206 [Mycena belliarum]|uniref:YCII-related domain-containing protein n=1 Tax=Mycena belliarum TaxID=1033014 RepID=A0AAD6XVX2_9AGAR|nr:hypothetical protein B0H15DRAFT_811206 [Mycena belliae]
MARKFAFFGPYITTPSAKELRSRLLAAHREALQAKKAAGVLKLGGPFYNDGGEGEGAADRAFGGSFLLLEAESYAAALEIIKGDEYYIHGLWDVPNIKLVEYSPGPEYPF